MWAIVGQGAAWRINNYCVEEEDLVYCTFEKRIENHVRISIV